MANAADAEAKSPLSPMATLDSLTVSDIPAAHKDEIPRPSSRLAGLNRLNDLDQLNQVVGLVSPLFGFVRTSADGSARRGPPGVPGGPRRAPTVRGGRDQSAVARNCVAASSA